MKSGRVIGRVVATCKDPSLTGLKLLLVRSTDWDGTDQKNTLVAVDTVGAGDSERVFYVESRDASLAVPTNPPVDATIVGIIDDVEF